MGLPFSVRPLRPMECRSPPGERIDAYCFGLLHQMKIVRNALKTLSNNCEANPLRNNQASHWKDTMVLCRRCPFPWMEQDLSRRRMIMKCTFGMYHKTLRR